MEFNWQVSQEEGEKKVRQVLGSRFNLSGRAIKKIRYYGEVLINGRPSRLADIIRPGDRVVVRLPGQEVTINHQVPEAEVVYENDWLVLVNKSADIVVHPTIAHDRYTVTSLLSDQGLHPVSRLDKQTSGLVPLAKNSHTHHQLSCQFIRRFYLAICHGRLSGESYLYPDCDLSSLLAEAGGSRLSASCLDFIHQHRAELEGSNLIVTPIARSDFSYMTRIVHPLGKPAISCYRELAYNQTADISLLELEIITGRTHQLRVQMLWTGHPLLGDDFYGWEFCSTRPEVQRPTALFYRLDWPRDFSDYPVSRVNPAYWPDAEEIFQSRSKLGNPLTSNFGLSRQALHCYHLSFTDPLSGDPLEVQAKLNLDMAALVKRFFPEWEAGLC